MLCVYIYFFLYGLYVLTRRRDERASGNWSECIRPCLYTPSGQWPLGIATPGYTARNANNAPHRPRARRRGAIGQWPMAIGHWPMATAPGATGPVHSLHWHP